MQKRLLFAKEHIHWKRSWKKIMFTDEKKLNLNGPDGDSYQYHNVRKEEIRTIRRQAEAENIMAEIGYNGKTVVHFIQGRSIKYIELINTKPAMTDQMTLFKLSDRISYTQRYHITI